MLQIMVLPICHHCQRILANFYVSYAVVFSSTDEGLWAQLNHCDVLSPWLLLSKKLGTMVVLSLPVLFLPGLWWGWYGGGGTAPSAGGRDQSGARPVRVQRHWLQVRPFWYSGVVHSYDCVHHCSYAIVLRRFLTIIICVSEKKNGMQLEWYYEIIQ